MSDKEGLNSVIWTFTNDFAEERGGFSMQSADFDELMALLLVDDFVKDLEERAKELGKDIEATVRRYKSFVSVVWKPTTKDADGR